VDAASLSLFVAGATNLLTDGQQTLTAEFALPDIPAAQAKSRELTSGQPQTEEPVRGSAEPTTGGREQREANSR
jgi:hypothetical protein